MFPEIIWQRVEAYNKKVVLERQPREVMYLHPEDSNKKGMLYRHDVHDPFEIIQDVDVCMFSRLQDNLKQGRSQKELQRLEKEFVLMLATPALRRAMPPDVLVDHALPSGDEYSEELHFGVDPRFQHWRSVKKGRYTKAAAFMHLMKPNYSLNHFWTKAKEAMQKRKAEFIRKSHQW